MSILSPIFLLLLCGQSLAEDEEFEEEVIFDNEPLDSYKPSDFRCFQFAFDRLVFEELTYRSMRYIANPSPGKPRECATDADDGSIIYYPLLTALDPMMPFYIHQITEGIPLVPTTEVVLSGTKAQRRKKYCVDMRLIGSTFIAYVETFHSEKQICQEINEIAIECSIFRSVWVDWVRNLYDRFCFDEDGCYNIMELYDDDMPYCVKYIASKQFQNASFGSWHHSILNYCELTDMVPQAKDDNYDRLIISEDGKTEDDLLTMCQFLRFRLLPEEGREEEIREITLGAKTRDAAKDEKNSAFNPDPVSVSLIIWQLRSRRLSTEGGCQISVQAVQGEAVGAPQMRVIMLLILAVLCKELTAATPTRFYDIRCEPAFSLDSLSKARAKLFELEFRRDLYESSQIVLCKEGHKNLQPDLAPTDHWAFLISSLKQLLNETNGLDLSCRNFPQYVEHMHVYLQNEDSHFEGDCEWVIDFCADCNGCPHVSDTVFTSYNSTITWALQTPEDGICQYDWGWENAREAMRQNFSWFHKLRHSCEECWKDQCNSAYAMDLYKSVLLDLGQSEAAWKKLCFTASLYGAMGSLHLQDRFGNFCYWIEQMRVFGHHEWKTDLFHIIWFSCTFVFLFIWPYNLCNPFRVSQKKAAVDDPIMEYVIRTLAAGKTRKARNLRRAARRAAKGLKKKGKKTGAKNKKRKTTKGKGKKSTAKPQPVKTLALPNGKVITARRGPGGKAGRGRGGRMGRGGRK